MAKCTRFHLLLIVALEMVVFAMADYRIGYSINSYSSTSNTLANGSCCGETCATSCRTTLRLCFRDAGHSHSDVESSCNAVQNRENTNVFTVVPSMGDSIQKYYSQTYQIYVRVSHSVNENTELANFDLPFTDPLIDDIFIEANVSAALFTRVLDITEIYTVTGDFGTATLTIAVNARCAENFFGDGCEMLCDPDCTTVLNPPEPQTMTTDAPETDPNQTSSTDQPDSPSTPPLVSTDQPDSPSTPPLVSTDQPDSPSTPPLLPSTDNTIIPIVVGVSIAVLVLIIIGVVTVILIICCVKRSRKGSWNPKRSTEPQYTMERVERNLTSNVNRFSVISDGGEEVAYAMVNKSPARSTRARSPPSPPPSYSTYKPEAYDEPTEIAPAMDFVVRNKDAEEHFAGYETVDFGSSTTTEENGTTEDQSSDIQYASLDIQDNGFEAEKIDFDIEADDTEEDQEPVSYTVVRHQDS